MKNTNQDNEKLVTRIKSGDQDAYKELLEAFNNMIRKLINTYSIEMGDYKFDYEDIYQEACLALYQACTNYKDDQGMQFSSYAYLLIRSRVINRIRKNYRVYKDEYFSIDNYENAEYDRHLVTTAVSDNPVAYHYKKSFNDQMYSFYNGLIKLDQDIIRLRSIGKTYKEISNDLGVSTKKIDNRLRFIKKKLKKYILDNEIE